MKRYRTEKGTAVVERLYEDRKGMDLLLTSHFTCLDVESVAARALKGQLLNQAAYEALLGILPGSRRSPFLQSISGDTVNDAVDASRQYYLRPADALQMASMQKARRAFPVDDFVFVASDRELLAAASAGMETFNPESDGAMERLRAMRG